MWLSKLPSQAARCSRSLLSQATIARATRGRAWEAGGSSCGDRGGVVADVQTGVRRVHCILYVHVARHCGEVGGPGFVPGNSPPPLRATYLAVASCPTEEDTRVAILLPLRRSRKCANSFPWILVKRVKARKGKIAVVCLFSGRALLFGIVWGGGGGCVRVGSMLPEGLLKTRRRSSRCIAPLRVVRTCSVKRFVRKEKKGERERGPLAPEPEHAQGRDTGRRSRGGGVDVARHPRSTHIHLVH